MTLKYQITRNGVAQSVQTAPTSQWNGGERGQVGDFYYHVMQGVVTGTQPGDSVKVWFTGAGQTSDSFTYSAKVESANRVLVLAAEDYTGLSPVYKSNPRPAYLSYYLDALAANGIGADVYDVDANGREAPSPLGVLSHYKAVIWYTGDDVITRDPGMVPGTASRLANDELLAVREYLNEGGRLLYTGKYAGLEYAQGYEFNPETNAPCDPNSAADGCQAPVRRLPAVLPRRVHLQRGRGHDREGDAVRRDGRGRSVQRAGLVLRLSERQQPGPLRLVHHDERHPAEGAVPAVRQLGGREVRAARRAVRPAYGLVLRVLATSRTSATSA